ncbi:MAG: restriction endonuclease subunit S, partial [Anaerolineales bacterium]|nr:restriction endonuclease subunit S [Anaerolineales bacterium]
MNSVQLSVTSNQLEGKRPLPEGWSWKTLRDILSTIKSGGRPKGGARGITEGVPSLGGEHLLYNGGFDFQEIKYVPNDYYAKMTRGKIKRHDVLVVKDGATTGKTSFVGDDFPFDNAAVNEHVFILRPAETLLPKYLFYWFQSPFGQDCVSDNFRGTAQGGITLGILDDSRFPLAPLDEQERIVARLKELLSDLEAGVAALERVRAGVKRYKASVLKAAVEGKLVKQDQNDEPASELLKRMLAKRRAKAFEAEIADLVIPPAGWVWATADQLSDPERSITYGVVKLGDEVEDGIPTLRSSNVRHLLLDTNVVKRISPTIANQ